MISKSAFAWGMVATCCMYSSQSLGQPVESKAVLGSKMFVAFQCSIYAEMSKKSVEQERLFNLGYDAGKKFMDAVIKGEISREELRTIVPSIVAMSLQGPTAEFVIGRIFEQAAQNAFDEVVKKDASGLVKKAEEWILDASLKKIVAEGKFHKTNCALIK